jgi:hypothetical protein
MYCVTCVYLTGRDIVEEFAFIYLELAQTGLDDVTDRYNSVCPISTHRFALAN